MTLKFNTVVEVVEVRVCAKFHQGKCGGSRVIVATERERKTSRGCWKQDNVQTNTESVQCISTAYSKVCRPI